MTWFYTVLCLLVISPIFWSIVLLRHMRQRPSAAQLKCNMETIPPADGCVDKFCKHGECIGHEPEWEAVGTGLRRMGFWEGLSVPPPSCCGAWMKLCRRVELRRCKKCTACRKIETCSGGHIAGRNEFAFCPCCLKVRHRTDCRFGDVSWTIPVDPTEPTLLG